MHEAVAWRVRWWVEKSDGPTFHGEGNMLLTAGANRILGLLIGDGSQALDATHCRIGVGDGTLAVAAGQTSLQGVNRYFSPATRSVTLDKLTVVASFGPYDGNFAWEEWGIDFGTAAGTTEVVPLLNRKVASIGTKASGATWNFTVEVTLG